MSNELIPAGGGAVVPASTSGAVGEHVGDLTVDRGTGAEPAIADDIAVHMNLTEAQKVAGRAWLVRFMEKRQQAAAAAAPAIDPNVRRRELSARRDELKGWLDAGDRRYWKDNNAQEEYRKLLGMDLSRDTSHPVPDHEVDARIAQIEGWMGTPKYSRNEAVQNELRELYGRRERARNRGA